MAYIPVLNQTILNNSAPKMPMYTINYLKLLWHTHFLNYLIYFQSKLFSFLKISAPKKWNSHQVYFFTAIQTYVYSIYKWKFPAAEAKIQKEND